MEKSMNFIGFIFGGAIKSNKIFVLEFDVNKQNIIKCYNYLFQIDISRLIACKVFEN